MHLVSGDQFKELKPQVTPQKGSERGKLIGWFTDELNKYRGGRKSLTYAGIGVKLAHIPTEDLYYLQSQMKQAKNPSAFFWWAIKAK